LRHSCETGCAVDPTWFVVGIMTAKLLVAFLRCFDDEFAEVRTEACIACSRLRIRDDQVLTKLTSLIRNDPIDHVKALAIQGLCYCSVVVD